MMNTTNSWLTVSIITCFYDLLKDEGWVNEKLCSQ